MTKTYKNIRITPKTGCAVCGCQIYDFFESPKGKIINIKRKSNYDEISVIWDDESSAVVSICKKCKETVTVADLEEWQKNQCYTWGREIIDHPLSVVELSKQLIWFIDCAIRLRIKDIKK